MSRRVEAPEATAQHLSRWYGPDLPYQAVLLRGSFIGWLFGMSGQAAVTINKTVHFTPRAPDLASHRGIALLGHELFHVLQQTQIGWWPFIFRYLIGWRPTHVREGWRHPLERPAYDRGREIRDSLA